MSPPNAGVTPARRIEPAGGLTAGVMSVCQPVRYPYCRRCFVVRVGVGEVAELPPAGDVAGVVEMLLPLQDIPRKGQV
ncbi:hypothetical protein [Micromonospora sp. LOL_024]|uniref:hypothetical protein n=1 Tax=Micromonospora sp. LOL_024 TaxID=3345412 RepID=UPI003A8A064D